MRRAPAIPWVLAAALGCGCAPAPPAEPVALATVHVRGFALQVEVAATPAAIERGLMFRRELHEDAGMLFVFPPGTALAFWMRNTFLPLTLAFLDASGTIVDIADLQPQDETPRAPSVPAAYAVEVNQGWLARRGIGPGERFDLSALGLPPAR